MSPFSKNSGEHKFLLDLLDSFFKRKFKVSSFQENQVWDAGLEIWYGKRDPVLGIHPESLLSR